MIGPLLVATEATTLADGELWRSLVAIVVVFGLLGGLAWAARRGRLGFFTKQPSSVRVEATVPLGERRSLMVVAIEGRRLLLGLTPMQVSFVTELARVTELSPPSPAASASGFGATPAPGAFGDVLARAQGSAASGTSTTHTP